MMYAKQYTKVSIPPFSKGGRGGLSDEKGMVLVVGLLLIVVLMLLGTTAVMMSTTDLKISSNYKTGVQAFYIAEAGLARAEAELINDLNADNDLSNTSFNAISGAITITPSSTDFYTPTDFNNISFGAGAYTIQFKNYAPDPAAPTVYDPATIWVRSIGTSPNSSTATLECYLSAENVSPWNNAVFAGGGGGAAPITGNVIIAGPIHLLGNGLAATDTVFVNQTGDCLNSNIGMDVTLAGKIAGGTTSDLDAKFRVKNGRVDMTVGSGKIGESSSPFKGIYVTTGADSGGDGVNDDILGGDNSGAGQNLYADKGATSAKAYDLGDYNIPMPTIDSGYMDAHSLNFGGPLTLSTSDIPTQSGTYGGEDCSIKFDATTKVLTIDGIIKVTSLNISTDITYAGKGTIYVTGTTETNINGNVLPATAASYPTTNVLGVVSTGNMALPSSSQKLLTGAFYSTGTITSNKQNELAGTIVCQNFNITAQVPKIWQVPSLATNPPPGMPGSGQNWVFTEKTWREIAE